MARGSGTAQDASTAALNNSNTLSGQTSAIYGGLEPQLMPRLRIRRA